MNALHKLSLFSRKIYGDQEVDHAIILGNDRVSLASGAAAAPANVLQYYDSSHGIRLYYFSRGS
jgi:hypothetical protein